MSRLLTTERDTYADLWASVERYADHAPGEAMLPVFLSIVGTARGTVLDAGTGSGKGALALVREGFDVACYDLTDAGLIAEAKHLPFRAGSLWHELPACDWVYCTDVLEHLPTQFTMLAVEQMVQAARRGVFLSVSLVPDHFGVWAGTPLHQTVQPFTWWRDSLREVGHITDARDLLHAATFYLD